jgi:hypothetical protein
VWTLRGRTSKPRADSPFRTRDSKLYRYAFRCPRYCQDILSYAHEGSAENRKLSIRSQHQSYSPSPLPLTQSSYHRSGIFGEDIVRLLSDRSGCGKKGLCRPLGEVGSKRGVDSEGSLLVSSLPRWPSSSSSSELESPSEITPCIKTQPGCQLCQ